MATRPRRKGWGYALAVFLLITTILLGLFPASNLTREGYYRTRLGAITGPDSFGLSLWTIRAFASKLAQALGPQPGAGLTDDEKQRIFADFFATADEANRLEWEIRDLANQRVPSSDPRMMEREQQLAELRKKRAGQSTLVEHIIGGQVEEVLKQEGLAIVQTDRLFCPPVIFDLIDLPHELIISPRERIEMRDQVALRRSITSHEINDLEETVDKELNVRSLVVPIGGIGTYPTMVGSTGPRDWMIGTVAHEWCHVYLTFHALGLSYGKNGEVTAMNETVCSIFENEIGGLVQEQFYGAERRPRVWEATPTPIPSEPPKREEPQGFNVNRELRKIYLAAVERLKENDITGAEAIMEEGRKFLAENGHYERKLNQAYFAFYGSYAPGPDAIRPDTLGDDLRELRRRSPSLRDFMLAVEKMTSYDDLKRALGKQ